MSIADIIAMKSDIVIFDEPIAALDPLKYKDTGGGPGKIKHGREKRCLFLYMMWISHTVGLKECLFFIREKL